MDGTSTVELVIGGLVEGRQHLGWLGRLGGLRDLERVPLGARLWDDEMLSL